MEEMGAVGITGSGGASSIANKTGSAVSTDIPVIRPKKMKKSPIVRRSPPINAVKSNG